MLNSKQTGQTEIKKQASKITLEFVEGRRGSADIHNGFNFLYLAKIWSLVTNMLNFITSLRCHIV
jgi:hypothetical protein